MDNVELGRKIKEARIARKMTQSEVVGTFITRNMLSQIESGAAAPSLKTLVYLSRVLDLQLTEMVSASSEDALFLLQEAKDCLRSNDILRLLEMEKSYPPQLEDEFAAIFSQAFLRYAKELLEKQEFQEAATLARRALDYSSKGIYANETVKSESILLLHTTARNLADYYKNLSE